MDPLSITAGVVSLADLAKRLSRSFDIIEIPRTITHELELYSQILEEVSQIALAGLSELPESAQLSLQLCHYELQEVAGIKEQLEKTDRKSRLKNNLSFEKQSAALQLAIKGYRRYVKILRDIVGDAITQQTLRERSSKGPENYIDGRLNIKNIINTSQPREMVQEQLNALISQIQSICNNTAIHGPVDIQNIFTDDPKETGKLSREVEDQLRNAASGVKSAAGISSIYDPFKFEAKLVGNFANQASTVLCAIFDTGSLDSWVSAAVVERLDLASSIRDLDEDISYSAANSSPIFAKGIINLSWTRNGIKSWQTDFLVLEGASFDLLVGRKFIIQEGLEVFSEPVLALDPTRLAPLTREEYKQLEQNIRKRGAENEELSKTREARDAIERERRRATKIATRNSSLLSSPISSRPRTPGTITPVSLSHIPSPLAGVQNATDDTIGAPLSSTSTTTQDSVSSPP